MTDALAKLIEQAKTKHGLTGTRYTITTEQFGYPMHRTTVNEVGWTDRAEEATVFDLADCDNPDIKLMYARGVDGTHHAAGQAL